MKNQSKETKSKREQEWAKMSKTQQNIWTGLTLVLFAVILYFIISFIGNIVGNMNKPDVNGKPEVKTVEKVVEKKVQYVHEDCEWMFDRLLYLLKLVETGVKSDTSADAIGIKSTVDMAHSSDVIKGVRNCLNNQSYVPKGAIDGRANQILWNDWQ